MMTANINFVVLKINDIDVGPLPLQQQQTALNLLLDEESENVVLHLKRKTCWNNKNILESDDLKVRNKMCYLKIKQHTTNRLDNSSLYVTDEPEIVLKLHLPSSSPLKEYCMAKATQTDDIAFYVHEHLRNIQKNTERLIEQEHNLFEQSLAPEIDIEEITLRKSDSNERLGLTVCYSNGDVCADNIIDCDTYSDATVGEVYISDIQPDSVAGRDGRLRQGDQIVQINGKDIKTRSETETLMAENNNAVTLLVSRYLYADEDDFNDPSTNEDDDEVLVIENEDDDEDDDDEFYDENNLTYVNCAINNDCCVNVKDELGKNCMSQIAQQKEQLQQTSKMSEEKSFLDTVVSTALTDSAYQDNTLKQTANSKKKKENVSKNEKKSTLNISTMVGTSLKSKADKKSSVIFSDSNANDDYESEHIYETIPDDRELEPFYCSPYDSSVYVTAIASCSSSTVTDDLQKLQQKQLVAHWLGIKPLQSHCTSTAPRRSSQSVNACGRVVAHRHKSNTGTVRSAVTTLNNGIIDCSVTSLRLPINSQLEDQDNSSSAYNTGGSNNSVSPVTLMLNPKNLTDPIHSFACTSINTTSTGATDNVLVMQPPNLKTSNQQKHNSPKEKFKITLPKGSSFQSVKTSNSGGANKLSLMDSNVLDKNVDINKDSNIHRNMLLRHHMVNQAMSVEKNLQSIPVHQNYYQQQSEQIQCPQFTAPNLSQYHFVSSQEVNNISLSNKVPKSSTTVTATITNNTKQDEETMVWKVKRRPDGTRYIVRRPAKNRVITERNTRLNVERIRNDITTTEDDTISEIKTGRYWTREERKKHIERAKERRQQQHQQKISHLSYDASAAANLCDGDVSAKTLHDSSEREKFKQQLNIMRQKNTTVHPVHQQHYQLQFNSVDDQKLNSSLTPNNVESTTNNSLLMVPITSEEVSIITNSLVKQEVLTSTTVFTSSEHNQIKNAFISVTTA